MRRTSQESHDTLDRLAGVAPPPGESPAERARRQREAQRQRDHSAEIDEQIKRDKALREKKKYNMRVLVVGQSESGMLFVSVTRIKLGSLTIARACREDNIDKK